VTWLLTDGFVWSGRTGRLRYLIAFAVLGGIWVALALAAFRGALAGDTHIAAVCALAFLLIPLVGFRLRRLHDIGLNGFWAVLSAIPYVNLVFEMLLLTVPRREIDYRPAAAFLRLTGLGLVGIAMLVILSRILWQPFWIPAASMKPTLLPGDYVLVRPVQATPRRGDVVVFGHPATGKDHIKRLIGLPGDRVRMTDGVLYINDQPAAQEPRGMYVEAYESQGPGGVLPQCANAGVALGGDCIKQLYAETLPEGQSLNILDIRQTALDNTAAFLVPPGFAFMLGDNRDNSLDSRLGQQAGGLGYVALQDIRARVEWVVFSAAGTSLAAFWSWRRGRFWTEVR